MATPTRCGSQRTVSQLQEWSHSTLSGIISSILFSRFRAGGGNGGARGKEAAAAAAAGSTAARIRRGGQVGGHPLESMAQRPSSTTRRGVTFLTFAALTRRCPFLPLHDLKPGSFRIPCSAALCTALSKKVVEVSLVAHLDEAAGRGCWSGIVELTAARGSTLAVH